MSTRTAVLLIGQPRTWLRCKSSLLKNVFADHDVFIVANGGDDTYVADVRATFGDRLKALKDIGRDAELVKRWDELVARVEPTVVAAGAAMERRKGQQCYKEFHSRGGSGNGSGNPLMIWLTTTGRQFYATDVAIECMREAEAAGARYNNVIRVRHDITVDMQFEPAVAPTDLRSWIFGNDTWTATEWNRLYGAVAVTATTPDTCTGKDQRLTTLYPSHVVRDMGGAYHSNRLFREAICAGDMSRPTVYLLNDLLWHGTRDVFNQLYGFSEIMFQRVDVECPFYWTPEWQLVEHATCVGVVPIMRLTGATVVR